MVWTSEESRFDSSRNKGICLLPKSNQTGSEAQPRSNSEGTLWALSSSKKLQEREANHLIPYIAVIKYEWTRTSSPLYDFMSCTETNFALPLLCINEIT